MWRIVGALGAALVALALSGCVSSPSPEQLRTQATIAAAQSNGYAREARAIEVTSTAQAIERAAMQATNAALAVTPSATPAPTIAPTLTPLPTATIAPTLAPVPTIAPTAQATIAPTATPQAPAKVNPRARTIYDDWPIVLLLGAGALALVVALWRLIDGKTTILPGRGDNNGR